MLTKNDLTNIVTGILVTNQNKIDKEKSELIIEFLDKENCLKVEKNINIPYIAKNERQRLYDVDEQFYIDKLFYKFLLFIFVFTINIAFFYATYQIICLKEINITDIDTIPITLIGIVSYITVLLAIIKINYEVLKDEL